MSSSVSTDTNYSSSFILHRPLSNPNPITPSLNTTSTNTPTFTPKTTHFKRQPQKSLGLPLSDTEFPLPDFVITPTHSPRSPQYS